MVPLWVLYPLESDVAVDAESGQKEVASKVVCSPTTGNSVKVSGFRERLPFSLLPFSICAALICTWLIPSPMNMKTYLGLACVSIDTAVAP